MDLVTSLNNVNISELPAVTTASEFASFQVIGATNGVAPALKRAIVTSTLVGALPSSGTHTYTGTLTITNTVVAGIGVFKAPSNTDRFDVLPQSTGGGVILAAFNAGATNYTPTTLDSVSWTFRMSGSGDNQVILTSGAEVELKANGKGILMKSPDGTRYRVSVANGGTIAVTAAP